MKVLFDLMEIGFLQADINNIKRIAELKGKDINKQSDLWFIISDAISDYRIDLELKNRKCVK